MAERKTLLTTVFSPYIHSDESENWRKRLNGRFALQLCVDTIAYAFNVPLRLALWDKGMDFHGTLGSLLREESPIRHILADLEDGPLDHVVNELKDPGRFNQAREMILGLLGDKNSTPEISLSQDYLRGLLAILPHLERKVWLTEIANPLPIHGLCRMYDPWSLYILMWTSKTLFADQPGQGLEFTDALGIDKFYVRTLPAIVVKDSSGEDISCVPVLGPVIEGDESSEYGESFIERFNRFDTNARKNAIEWGSEASGKPTREELVDALQSRMTLPKTEIEQRACYCQSSLELLYSTALPDGFPESVSRDFWEKLATGVAWLAKSEESIRKAHSRDSNRSQIVKLDDGYVLSARLAGDQLNLCIERLQVGAPTQMVEVGDACDSLQSFFNRVRERQSAAWTFQIIAINNLLNRHGLSDGAKVPGDNLVCTDEAKPELGHLLRGFGHRVCRYLVSITRADVADLYWADYAQSPPRLINVGCYARLAEHRARVKKIESLFHEWAWTSGVNQASPANMREMSPAQTYRTLASGQEDPLEGKCIEPIPRDTPIATSVHEGKAYAFFSSYEPSQDEGITWRSPVPSDGLALPLMLNGRPVGVVSLAGLSDRQFDRRIFIPLRRAASLLATSMYHQSQLWHMRILNTFFVNYQAQSWGEIEKPDESSRNNPLRTVARCLCNLFLCPLAHVWTRSRANANRYELSGYNWPEIFDTVEARGRKVDFSYHTVGEGEARSPRNSKLAELAIDLYAADSNSIGKFVWGRFDPILAESTGFDVRTASTQGVHLGQDMLVGQNADSSYRSRIFSPRPEGYALTDIMSFPLLRRKRQGSELTDMEVVGAVTLHDWARTTEAADRERWPSPWDRGWRTVVAHIQTYLPYLLEQVEILNNPMVDARRFLIHAGRAEITGMLELARLLRKNTYSSLAPNGSVRKGLQHVLSRNFFGSEKMITTVDARRLVADNLNHADLALQHAWEAIENLVDLGREQDLVQLANVMHRYRDLAALSVEITDTLQVINLRDEVEGILSGFQGSLFERGVFKSNDLPTNINLRLPRLWFRIVLGDLFHNAAKYATSGLALGVAWNNKHNTLQLVNEGPYDAAIDDPQKLLLPGKRGSAANNSRQATYVGKRIGGAGQGMGLWGANTMCELMGIGFQFDIRPYPSRAEQPSLGHARYEVKLQFPHWMLNVYRRMRDADFA